MKIQVMKVDEKGYVISKGKRKTASVFLKIS